MKPPYKKQHRKRVLRFIFIPFLLALDSLIAWTGFRKWEELRRESKEVIEHPFMRTMKLCPLCGNKRCPKATDIALDCTNSNEPGQPGSIY